ncbi:unnamed protein product [Macrosiphum euphorbiae]|uniref:Uncharacterized protein n=1 Tax=Macrosiphum euphorbiae TaxID=13131 RepID=A0AAV0VXP5_9HEMI|nr:unnamed protein product [Macrosiphum euphorbiae]
MDTRYLGSTKCVQSFNRAIEVRSLIGRLDLAVDRRIADVVKITSPPVPAPVVHMTPEVDAHVEKPRSLRHYSPSLTDSLDLAVDRRIADVSFPSRLGHAKSFQSSSSELCTDSPVYHLQVVKITSPPVPAPAVHMTLEVDAHVETPRSLRHYSPSLTDALHLAVDWRIAAVRLLQLRRRREHTASFQSSVELSVRSPVYGAVKSVPPVAADETLQNPVRSDLLRSVWKRSKRFVWKSMVNAARRICLCRSFVDLE